MASFWGDDTGGTFVSGKRRPTNAGSPFAPTAPSTTAVPRERGGRGGGRTDPGWPGHEIGRAHV